MGPGKDLSRRGSFRKNGENEKMQEKGLCHHSEGKGGPVGKRSRILQKRTHREKGFQAGQLP